MYVSKAVSKPSMIWITYSSVNSLLVCVCLTQVGHVLSKTTFYHPSLPIREGDNFVICSMHDRNLGLFVSPLRSSATEFVAQPIEK